ncbi:hypothetical protein ACH5RR_034234 [Cinchona calisaya]|uniref:Uncharacterized protein n=1 Tax=Cinchona calisaya TaxID=153742 RepID=A0ABD2YFR3_9GENT
MVPHRNPLTGLAIHRRPLSPAILKTTKKVRSFRVANAELNGVVAQTEALLERLNKLREEEQRLLLEREAARAAREAACLDLVGERFVVVESEKDIKAVERLLQEKNNWKVTLLAKPKIAAARLRKEKARKLVEIARGCSTNAELSSHIRSYLHSNLAFSSPYFLSRHRANSPLTSLFAASFTSTPTTPRQQNSVWPLCLGEIPFSLNWKVLSTYEVSHPGMDIVLYKLNRVKWVDTSPKAVDLKIEERP